MARSKPRLRGAIHLRLHPLVSIGLNLSDVVDLARDGAKAVRKAVGGVVSKTPVGQRIKQKADEKRRYRIAQDVVDADFEETSEKADEETVLRDARDCLVGMGFKRQAATDAVEAVRSEAADGDVGQVVRAALRSIR